MHPGLLHGLALLHGLKLPLVLVAGRVGETVCYRVVAETRSARIEVIVEARLRDGRVEHRIARIIRGEGVSPLHIAGVIDAILRGGGGGSMLRGRGRKVTRMNTGMGVLLIRRSYGGDGWLVSATVEGRGVAARAERVGCGGADGG